MSLIPDPAMPPVERALVQDAADALTAYAATQDREHLWDARRAILCLWTYVNDETPGGWAGGTEITL